MPIGWWRSVYSSQNAFAEEAFMDELARAAGVDPLAFRLELAKDDAREPLLRAVDQCAVKRFIAAPAPIEVELVESALGAARPN